MAAAVQPVAGVHQRSTLCVPWTASPKGSSLQRGYSLQRACVANFLSAGVQIPEEGMGVEELADTLAMPAGEVVKILFMKGIMVQVNQVHH